MRRIILIPLFVLSFVTLLSVFIPEVVFAESESERKVRLEQQLQNVEQQIIKQQVLVEDKQQERQSLERDVDILDAQIYKAKLGIQARSLAIGQLSNQIGDKVVIIEILNERLEKHRQSLAELVRKTNEVDDYSLTEILLGQQSFSAFFEDFENFQSIRSSLNTSVDVLKGIRSDTNGQKTSLENKKETEAALKQLQESEKVQIESREKKKEQILTVTKGQEAAYQKLLESQQKTASQLRTALFQLSGGGGAIPFPKAVELAQFASKRTGVSAALILAILEQESAYGSNIGSCSYNETVQGRPVMHPDRDQPVFLAIAKVIGFDPQSKLVSCPWIRNGERLGWGGAMGPSQFIPSTWAAYGGIVSGQYVKSKDLIRSVIGKNSPSSPFINQDAFTATALLLRDNGAGSSYNSQWTAAIRYFAGWSGASNPVNHPYGDNVMARKARLDNEIRILSGG